MLKDWSIGYLVEARERTLWMRYSKKYYQIRKCDLRSQGPALSKKEKIIKKWKRKEKKKDKGKQDQTVDYGMR